MASQHTKVVATLWEPVRYRAQLDLHSWLQRIAFITGSYEPETSALLIDIYERDGRRGCFLDIGANVGLICIPFAMHYRDRKCQCFAIEMVPDNFATLVENIELNGLSKVVIPINVGLGDAQRKAKFRVEGDLSLGEGTGTANILPDDPNQLTRYNKFDSANGVPVTIDTLDSIADHYVRSPCSLMKIDADGYDLKILYDAKSFIAKNRPIIFGEFGRYCMGWHGQQASDLLAFAREMRYDPFSQLASGLFAAGVSDSEAGVLLLPGELRTSINIDHLISSH